MNNETIHDLTPIEWLTKCKNTAALIDTTKDKKYAAYLTALFNLFSAHAVEKDTQVNET